MVNPKIFARISKRIDSFRNDMIDMQIKLCALPAIAPASGGQGEGRKAEFLTKHLEHNGFTDVRQIKAPDLDCPGRLPSPIFWLSTRERTHPRRSGS